MDHGDAYRAAWRVIGRLTPLDVDCGRLCNSRCCRGGDDHGMILFPGEQTVLAGAGYTIEKTVLRGMVVHRAVCGGRCIRAVRPLSCRIFPLAPRLDGDRHTVVFDPRATVCPLSQAQQSITPAFRAAVTAAVDGLRAIDGFDDFLRVYTAVLDDYAAFTL